LHHYSADKVGVIDEVIKGFVPGFGGNTSGSDHVRQFFDPVIGQGGDCFAGPEVNADDVAICEVVVVRDDSFEKLTLPTRDPLRPRTGASEALRCSLTPPLAVG